ncbi:hypothetical protein DL766_005032 [Monosporascus sp. MC13-8B]|uniref:Uncharacterized protein n=1 Tax=Monosporascus cannonballus TaxID=155416 RepID=A0ABY0GYQ1_9PEZI|nr:hypothetical protein DL762_009183 [Monosporascus cannonballus]RYO85165.1 hypothetical protein DL763_007188 [Monosporascus cannonballus]RYP30096.1 hypothetical protein DL766_005032 [Monosporascus sp. MC13-8B]
MDDDLDSPAFTGLFLADDEISDLDLSPKNPPRTPVRNTQHPKRRSRSAKRRTNHHEPSTITRPHPNFTDVSLQSSEGRPSADAAAAADEDGIFDIASWEEDVAPDSSYAPPIGTHHHQQQQQQLDPGAAESIAQVARLCVAASARLFAVARENQHLAVEAGVVLDSWVLRPCLRLGADLARAYCPEGVRALRDAEMQVRRVVSGGGRHPAGRGSRSGSSSSKSGAANGSGTGSSSAVAGGNTEREVLRLKDRLVEQDALLRDWNQHIRRLMRERDRLRKRLLASQERGQGQGQGRDPANGEWQLQLSPGDCAQKAGGSAGPDNYHSEPEKEGPTPILGASNGERRGSGDSVNRHANTQQLTEQLRQLQVLLDQLTIHEVLDDDDDAAADNNEGYLGPAERDELPRPDGGVGDSADEDWTLL